MVESSLSEGTSIGPMSSVTWKKMNKLKNTTSELISRLINVIIWFWLITLVNLRNMLSSKYIQDRFEYVTCNVIASN